jgi:GABA permease
MWAYPYLTWFAIAAIAVVIGSMAFVADVRSQLWLGLLSVGVVLLAYWAKSARQRSRGVPVDARRFARERDAASTPLQQ